MKLLVGPAVVVVVVEASCLDVVCRITGTNADTDDTASKALVAKRATFIVDSDTTGSSSTSSTIIYGSFSALCASKFDNTLSAVMPIARKAHFICVTYVTYDVQLCGNEYRYDYIWVRKKQHP